MARPRPQPEPEPEPAARSRARPDPDPAPGPDPAPPAGAGETPGKPKSKARGKRNPTSAEHRAIAAEFGARLKAARLEVGLGFNEAAQKLGLPQKVRLAEYESGKKVLSLPRFLEIVRVLGLMPETLFPEWFEGWERKRPKWERKKPKKTRE